MAIDFRHTLTAELLHKLNVKTEQQAVAVHKSVGAKVRKTIKDSGNTLPEDLPAEPNIKLIRRIVDRAKELPTKADLKLLA